jgi:hypothetical protein
MLQAKSGQRIRENWSRFKWRRRGNPRENKKKSGE